MSDEKESRQVRRAREREEAKKAVPGASTPVAMALAAKEAQATIDRHDRPGRWLYAITMVGATKPLQKGAHVSTGLEDTIAFLDLMLPELVDGVWIIDIRSPTGHIWKKSWNSVDKRQATEDEVLSFASWSERRGALRKMGIKQYQDDN